MAADALTGPHPDGDPPVWWTVGEVASLAGVTVRTLHHYDEVGLVRPSGRSAGGYRLYADADLHRLQRVLAYRELGMGLAETARLLDDPGIDALDHLRRLYDRTSEWRDRLDRILRTLERTMDAHRMGIRLTPEEMLEVFDGFDPTVHAEEVERRWGGTDPATQSARRTAAYGKDDWQRLLAEGDGITRRLADLMLAGEPATGDAATDAAEAARRHIDAWFYDCPPEMHRALADMYVADDRFRATYEAVAAGLARYVHDAIHANADRSRPRG